MQQTDIIQRLNVTVVGQGEPTLVMAHGFGSDQTAWRHQIADLAARHRIVLFDHLGCGKAEVRDYDPRRYNHLERYAEDILQIYGAMGLRETVFVGHSVSAMIGMLASFAAPAGIARLVFIGASPRYLNDGGYVGGFTQADLNALYALMADNYLGWANGFGPLAMDNAERPELGQEFVGSLAAMRPDIAQSTARVIFESDLRDQLPLVRLPTLILQTEHDIVVPRQVGDFLAQQIAGSRYQILPARGHLPHLSAPEAVTAALREFITV